MTLHVLDNPLWHSLTTDQARFACGGPLALRYPATVAPFAAVSETTASAESELCQLVEPGDSVYLVGLAPAFGEHWTLLSSGRIVQMLWQTQAAIDDATVAIHDDAGAAISELTNADTADMIALTTLVFPGFFRPRTPEMGMYVGIRQNGILAAMAGERMRSSGYQEISAVCTHPDFTGRGYAARLVMLLVDLARQRGVTPFLHVGEANTRARSLYSRLGFVERCMLPLWLVRREAQ
jgi:GNAT superfamily N-acetyltransferase